MRDNDDPKFASPDGVDKDTLHDEMLHRRKECRDYWQSQYDEAKADMVFGFTPDSQWDPWMVETRKGRPMYTVNKLRQAMKQITNDQRQNRPQAKVRPAEGGDISLAEVRQGLIRNIDGQLDAQRAVDTGFQFAVGGGFGVWRITTGYADDGGFDQVIAREEIPNPYTVSFDPAARKKDRRDARYAFVDSKWSRQAFKARWPDAKLVSVDDCDELRLDWFDEHEVIVSEYWYVETETYEIVLMSDGTVYDANKLSLILDELAKQGITVQRRRNAERPKVWHTIVSGEEILEGPNEWPGRFIPLVPVWGELINLNGKDQFSGAVRYGKDAQRMYNYERSTFIEVLADQPYSPLMAAADSVEGYEDQYRNLRVKRDPVLFYNADPSLPNGGKPSREAPPAFPAALANAAQISSDDIKAATGIYDASLGARSNETSGRAIIARQREGDVANFDFIDNLAYALKYDFEIINDLITQVYDTQRQVRIVGEDGAEKVVEINKTIIDEQTGEEVTLNDMSQGRFDVAVTVGPSYTTQRMEAAEALQQLANDPSPMGMIAKLGFIEALDAPGLETLKKAARKALVAQGLIDPGPEDGPPPAPPQPNPKDVADAQEKQSQARLNDAKTEQIQHDMHREVAMDQVALGIVGGPQPMQPPGPPPMAPPAPMTPPPGGVSVSGPEPTAPGGFPGMP